MNADQCVVDADCVKLGLKLPVCEAGVCVADTNSGGSGGSGGTSAEAGAPNQIAGMPTGDAGAPPIAECATNAECIDAHFEQPYVCRAGKCIGLLTDECPQVVGAANLRAPQPIVFGAYALTPDGVQESNVTRNLELAVSEFTSKVTGLRGPLDGSRRTLSFVVCNSYHPDAAPGTIDAFLPSLEHLVDELHVPGVVAALQAKDLQAVFAQKLNAAGTFVISPYEQDSEIAALTDQGRLWNMLGATSDLAPAFGPLLKRTETYLRRDESFLNLPKPGAPLRVALVTANIARETDVRDGLLDLPELADFEVKPFQIESALLNPMPDVSSVTGQLLDFAPNIIVALAGSEFIESVFPAIEAGTVWYTRTKNQQRPMYLLGSTMAPETWSLYSGKQGDPGGWKSFFDRIVGVAYASAQDDKLLKDYELRFIEANQDLADPSVALGSESAYDAAYLLIYAAAGAGEVPDLSGKDLAIGMRRLLGGTAYDVGPTAISKVLTALDNGSDIGLNLTLGPPDWNVAHGTRTGVGSVYCLNNNNSPGENGLPLGPLRDVLRFDPKTNALETKPLPCFQNF